MSAYIAQEIFVFNHYSVTDNPFILAIISAWNFSFVVVSEMSVDLTGASFDLIWRMRKTNAVITAIITTNTQTVIIIIIVKISVP